MYIERINETWEYDGSFGGFLTLVYYAFSEKKFPETILTSEKAIELLFTNRSILTNEIISKKIYRRLVNQLKRENSQFIFDAFYCSLASKERCLLDAINIGLETTDLLENYLGHPSILALKKSLNQLLSEVHQLTGFLRFNYVGTILYSTIEPKHFSLPFLCPHFANRYPQQTMIIYDETHRLLAIIEKQKISFIENSAPPDYCLSENETTIESYWLRFLESVTINERKNEKIQLNHLPKRYRKNMIDFPQNR